MKESLPGGKPMNGAVSGSSHFSELLVSVAELVEVRAAPLQPHELLSIAAAGAVSLPSCPPGRAFGPAQVFIDQEGRVKIDTVQSESLETEFLPPEWSNGEADPNAAAVYCIGAVLRWAGAATAADADLFSLVNVLTVSMIGTRPTATRMGQMAKNQLRGRLPAPVLQAAFQEIMGDGSDMLDDDEDDISFNSDDVPVLRPANKSTVTAGSFTVSTVHEASSADVVKKKQAVEYISEDEIAEESSEEEEEEDEQGRAIQESRLEEKSDEISSRLEMESPQASSTRIFDPDEKEENESSKKQADQSSSVLSALRNSREDERVLASSFAFEQNPSRKINSFDDEDDIVQAVVDDVDADVINGRGRYFDEIAVEREKEPEKKLWEKKQSNQEESDRNADSATIKKEAERRSVNEWEEEGEDTNIHSDSESRNHVDAVIIHERNSSHNGDVSEEEDERTETAIEKAFQEAVAQRRTSLGSAAAILPQPPPQPTGVPISSVAAIATGPFRRQNSLAASRVSGRNSKRRPKKTRAEPEFVEKEFLPSIRLKAPPTRKRNLLSRVETTSVNVRLLDGQLIEVSCRSDAIASDIFTLVVTNSNISENIFFGLCFIRDGEQFFLEDNQRLEKFAPPGWKSPDASGHSPNPYNLYLRFRFYPASDDFIKTAATRHALYVQLRRDILEGRLEASRDNSFDLAALALQAEFGDRPPPAVIDYFDPKHYLPQRLLEKEDKNRLRPLLAELHSHYSGTKLQAAETRYIKGCQSLPDFGGHWYRVFRTKSSAHSSAASPFDSDTGAALWLGIMPKGIVIAEQQVGARRPQAEHPWQRTHTLQFDKKRFVIVDMLTDGEGERRQTVLYTDHHTKSSYFVRFAASQHRFMIKMRQWKNQLKSERRVAAMPDVAVEGREHRNPFDDQPDSPLESSASIFEKVAASSRRPSQGLSMSSSSSAAGPSRGFAEYSNRNREESLHSNHMNNSTQENSLPRDALHSKNSSFLPTASEGEFLTLSIVKDPNAGIGLTLVDGQLNGVSGVYVKNVTDGGPGAKAGLCVGDRLLSVNGESLISSDRHRAVALVKQSSLLVTMEVARLDAIVTQHSNVALDISGGTARRSHPLSAADLASGSLAALTRPPQTAVASKGGSRTPPAPRKTQPRRARAVSDFGALGDALPELNSEDLLADMKSLSGLPLGESDDETTGEYRVPLSTSIYETPDADGPDSPIGSIVTDVEKRKGGEVSNRSSKSSSATMSRANHNRRSNQEWADDLEEVGEETYSSTSDEEGDTVEVELERNESGSLGVQVASTDGRVRIQAITARPALDHPLMATEDYLIAVNGESTEGHSHAEVVAMLKGGGQKVRLGLQRGQREHKIRVLLEKGNTGTLGLSLARRMGCNGVFIRMIGAGGAAEAVGTLRVGDRIWKVDGERVGDQSPTRIVERLKSATGPVLLIVRRPANSAAYYDLPSDRANGTP